MLIPDCHVSTSDRHLETACVILPICGKKIYAEKTLKPIYLQIPNPNPKSLSDLIDTLQDQQQQQRLVKVLIEF